MTVEEIFKLGQWADVVIKGEQKPPDGFSAIPGSKRGGYHKRAGDHYQTWYPGHGTKTWSAKESANTSGVGTRGDSMVYSHGDHTVEDYGDSVDQRHQADRIKIHGSVGEAMDEIHDGQDGGPLVEQAVVLRKKEYDANVAYEKNQARFRKPTPSFRP